MKRIIDDEKKIIWYYSESGFPTYMAISNYRKQNPSFEHSIASKETWEKLTKNQKNMVQEIKKIIMDTADKLSILQQSVNAFFIKFFDGMYPEKVDRDPDLVKLKRVETPNQFNGIDNDYSDVDIKMDITKAFTHIIEQGDGVEMLKEENVPFEDSVERLVLEELTNTENGYGYDFNDDVE